MLLCLGFNTSARYATIIGKKKTKKNLLFCTLRYWNKAHYCSNLEGLLLNFHKQQPVGKILSKSLEMCRINFFLIRNNLKLF